MLKGCFWGAFGAPKGALETSRGGPWTPWKLQGRPRKALGVLRECLGEALGSFLELRGRVGS